MLNEQISKKELAALCEASPLLNVSLTAVLIAGGFWMIDLFSSGYAELADFGDVSIFDFFVLADADTRAEMARQITLPWMASALCEILAILLAIPGSICCGVGLIRNVSSKGRDEMSDDGGSKNKENVLAREQTEDTSDESLIPRLFDDNVRYQRWERLSLQSGIPQYSRKR